MRLHLLWLLGFRQDFEQFISRKEIESRERRSLFLQVVVETFLDLFELLKAIFESLAEVGNLDDFKGSRLLNDSIHQTLPSFVNVLEHCALSWHLLLDILG